MKKDTQLYDKDFYAWTQETLKAIKEQRVNEIDWEHLAEEVESMGASDYRELKSRLIVLIAHLLKWEYQSKERSSSWVGTIDEQRTQLQELLEQSPSLKNKAIDAVNGDKVHAKALHVVARDTGIPKKAFPENCPYTLNQLLDYDFYPESE